MAATQASGFADFILQCQSEFESHTHNPWGTSVNNRPKTAVIIGAGPAGLTAAFELLRNTNIKPIVLEKSDQMGASRAPLITKATEWISAVTVSFRRVI